MRRALVPNLLFFVVSGFHKFWLENGHVQGELSGRDRHVKELKGKDIKVFASESSLDKTAEASVEKSGDYVDPTTLTDGAWQVSDWSECDVLCGGGTRKRTVVCQSESTGEVLLDSVCEVSTGIGRPDSAEDCGGDCVNCTVSHSDLFSRSGLGSPPNPAVYDVQLNGSYTLCQVEDPSVSCCAASNEEYIRAGASRMSNSLEGLLQQTPQLKSSTREALRTYQSLIKQRLAETHSALSSIQSAIDAKKTDPYMVFESIADVLHARITALREAVEIVSKALHLVDQQIDVFASALTDTSGKATSFSQCAKTAISMYANIACSTCSPSFPSSYLDPINNVMNVSTSDCSTFYNSCKGTISQSYLLLRQALTELNKVHITLTEAAMTIQPTLAILWKKLQFNWVPSSVRPSDLAGSPDVTKLSCIRQSIMFSLPSITQQSDFCGLYVSPFASDTFSNRLTAMLQQGVTALKDLTACDGCVHGILVRLPNLVINGIGSLDVQLNSETALGYSSCVMAAGQQSSMNFVNLARKEKNLKNRKFKSFTMLKMQGSRSSPVKVQFVSSGVTASVEGNFTSWDSLTQISSYLPPPPAWEQRKIGVSSLAVWDQACTSHSDCQSAAGGSGDNPAAWWFCASKTACSGGTAGLCSQADVALLAAGSRCAKGHCTDGSLAVDGMCPDFAVCPSTASDGFAGASYFMKYQKVVDEDPTDSGVCDCAFEGQSSSSLIELSNTTVSTGCMQAQCALYASLSESSAGCKRKLVSLCESLENSCPGLECTENFAKWNPPVCSAVSYSSNSTMLTGPPPVLFTGEWKWREWLVVGLAGGMGGVGIAAGLWMGLR